MVQRKRPGRSVWAAMLAIVLLLTACGSSGGESSTAPQGSSTAASEGGREAPYEIHMVFIGQDQKDFPLIQEELSRLAKEKINATVKLTPINWGAWSQQTTLMLAGNEKIDLMVTSNTLYNYSTQVAKGQLLPLNDLLDSHGQGIKEALGEDFLSAATVDGQAYGVPSLRDMAVNYGFTMRQDLLDKYSIDINSIKTLDDVEAAFKTVKENEPDVTPFVSAIGGATPIELLYPAYFDLLGDSLGVLPGYDNNLKVVNMYETPEYAELVKRARRWYEAGYIAKDASTTREDSSTLMKAGTAFAAASNLKPGIESQVSNAAGRPVKAAAIFPPVYSTGTISSFMFSIPISSQYPEKAMEFLNLMYTDPEIVNLLDYGIEGKHYVKKSDNVVGFPDGVDGTNSGYNLQQGWMFGNQLISYVWEDNAPDIWEQTRAFNESAKRSKALGFIYNSEPVKTEVAAVLNVVSQFKMGLETGSVDPEKVLPQFIEQMKAAGIDKIIAEKQKQLDAWAAKQ